jgi:hypothetical protein
MLEFINKRESKESSIELEKLRVFVDFAYGMVMAYMVSE